MRTIEDVVMVGSSYGASDIHICANQPVKYRIHGELCSLDSMVVSEEESESMAKALAQDEFNCIKDIGELDLACTIADRRCRINIFKRMQTYSIALRLLHDGIPKMEDLGLPKIVKTFAEYTKGIVLVTGETGSGKSTTLASLLDHINHTRNEHIITLEDPIEYIYESDRCLVSQREIHTDTRSYADGVRAILREDPDIILIGEMRDPITIETALTAAETGHLVFATLHTNGAADTIERIVSSFDADRQAMIRSQLAQTLNAVVSQQLLPKANGKGRVLACEVMVVNTAIRNQIREGKIPQIESSIMTGASWGCLSSDKCIQQLFEAGLIDAEVASKYSKHISNEEKTDLKRSNIPFSSYGKR